MSEKFDMKVVIDPVTTPLLHARLRAARSYRERAAILRSLAESALRDIPAALPVAASPDHPEAPVHLPRAAGESIEPVAPLLNRAPLPELLTETTSDGHDVVALADQFASFLDADT